MYTVVTKYKFHCMIFQPSGVYTYSSLSIEMISNVQDRIFRIWSSGKLTDLLVTSFPRFLLTLRGTVPRLFTSEKQSNQNNYHRDHPKKKFFFFVVTFEEVIKIDSIFYQFINALQLKQNCLERR